MHWSRVRDVDSRVKMDVNKWQMLTATFDVICDVALSGRDHFDSAAFGDAITRYFKTAGRASLLDFLGKLSAVNRSPRQPPIP